MCALMPSTGLRPHRQRLPPALDIIALVTSFSLLSFWTGSNLREAGFP
jgi:hypothetical protein